MKTNPSVRSRTLPRRARLLPWFAAASLPASFLTAATIDGIRDVGDGYTELAVQGTTSNWGDGGHEALANFHAKQDGSGVSFHLGARVQNRGIVIFIDSKPGGRNFIPNNTITSGGEENTINGFGSSDTAGMTFETGFAADYAIRVFGDGGDNAYVNLYDLTTGVRSYNGNCGPSDITNSGFIAAMRSNGLGFTPIGTPPVDYATRTNGIEARLSFAGLGVPSGNQTIKFMAILVNADTNYASNQVLAGRANTADIAGAINSINFETEDGVQTLSLAVENSDNDNDGTPDGTDPDDDNDGLDDVVETNTGTYVSPTDTGSNPLIADTDGDGFNDGAEVNGTTTLGVLISDPNVFNPLDIVAAGNFPQGESNDWKPAGVSVPNTFATRRGNDLTQQYQFDLDFHLTTANQAIAYKYTNALDWGASGHRNWGAGATAGTLAVNGGDLTATVGPTGIYRFSGDFKALTHSLVRRDFSTEIYGIFQDAYGLGNAGDDDDGDGLTNEQERAANTDPENADTDGDGLEDDVDPEPLVRAPESRNVVFRVNMNVQAALGTFDLSTDNVVVKVFSGVLAGGGDISMSDIDDDGIYESAPIAVSGFAGTSFGNFKFFNTTPGAPNGGYEEGADRNFTLAADGTPQTVPDPIAFFGNNSTMPDGYATWAGSGGYNLAPKDARGDDADDDGFTNHQEFSFGTVPNVPNGSLLTTTPGAGTMVLSWLQRNSGITYTLKENTDLGVWGPSAIVPSAAPDQTGVPAGYTRYQAVVPTSPDPKRFFTVEAEE